MGSPVSAVVANLYMKFFEMGFKEELLCYLDRARLTIKFTMEQEENGAHFSLTHCSGEERMAAWTYLGQELLVKKVLQNNFPRGGGVGWGHALSKCLHTHRSVVSVLNYLHTLPLSILILPRYLLLPSYL